jgi:hypothetical protein
MTTLEREKLRAIVEEMHRHVVGALTAHHSSETPMIPVRLVGKWVTQFDDVIGRAAGDTGKGPTQP